MRWKQIPPEWRSHLIEWIGVYLKFGTSARCYCQARGLNYSTARRYLNTKTRGEVIETWMNAKG